MKKAFLVLSIYVLISCSTRVNEKASEFELDKRLRISVDRIMKGDEPVFDMDFIVQDVALNPLFARRFEEFSGDLSGRYLGAVSKLNPESPFLKEVFKTIISHQKPDGRFGNEKLKFSADSISKTHMALLWGNGRMLTALIDYYLYTRDSLAYSSAIKSGNFLAKIAYSCTDKRIIDWLKEEGANGIICFTQLTEGLAMLYHETKNKKYLEVIDAIYPILPSRGSQHSHGYLVTLRGILKAYQYTNDKKYLDFVKSRYDSLINSDDYKIMGGVAEYFGYPPRSPNDEGCSEADLTMLSLQLYQMTKQISYLEKSEYCLLNQFYHNQFKSGEFGHHRIGENNFYFDGNLNKSWWCCTFHGLECLTEIKKNTMVINQDTVALNLFIENSMTQGRFECTLKDISSTEKTQYALNIKVKGAEPGIVKIRKPKWADHYQVTASIQRQKEDSSFLYYKSSNKHEDFVISYTMKLQYVDRNLKPIDFSSDNLKKGSIIYGPYLLGADQNKNSGFVGVPNYNNRIFVNNIIIKNEKARQVSYLYKHDGYQKNGTVILRPIGDSGMEDHSQVIFGFNLGIYQR